MLNLSQKVNSYLNACVVSTLLILIPEIAQAQIKMHPLVIEKDAKQGQAQGIINVTNTGSKIFRARVYSSPFTYKQNGFENLKASPHDLTPYLIFSPRELVVEPGQTRQIRMNTRLLPSMKEGEYRAVIFTENLQAVENNGSGMSIGVVPRIGATFFVRHGEASPNLVVQNATYNPKTKRIILLVKNTGNASVRPETNWTLNNADREIVKGEAGKTTVIAEGERNIQIDLSKNQEKVAVGNYKLTGELIWKEGKKDKSLPFNVDVNISDKVATTDTTATDAIDNQKVSLESRLKMLLKSN